MNTRLLHASTLAVVALGAGCTAAALVATARYGPGYASDAVTYLSVARSLAAGEGFQAHWGPYVQWPPLFPSLMAAAEALGASAMAAARWLNALCYGAAVVVTAALMRRAVPSRRFVVWGALAAAGSLPLLRMAVKAETEALFTLLVVLFAGATARYLRRPSWNTVAAMALAAAAACLQRYAGVWLVGSGIGAVVLRPLLMRGAPRFSWKKRLLQGIAFAAGASLPLGGWLVRNRVVTGAFTGRAAPSGHPEHHLSQSVAALADVLTGWVVPPLGPVWARVLLVLGALSLAAAAACWYGRCVPLPEAPEDPPSGRRSVRWAAAGLVGAYLPFIVLAATVEASSLPSRRLLTPVFPLVVLLAAAGLDALARRLPSAASGPSWAQRAFVVLCFAWLCYPLALGGAYVAVRADIGGGGYNTDAWQTSETARWLRAHALDDAPVRSNERSALYFLTKAAPPAREARAGADGYYLVCFDNPKRARLHPRRLIEQWAWLAPGVEAEALDVSPVPDRWPARRCFDSSLSRASRRVTEVAALADGTVYRVAY
ncbi:MAG: hypothetical protein BRD37_08470 [Bacteroidetes bacterium QH_8_67_23]|nr:MAG: hypothetical protein BRD37_08470 [Bacteroidetes bacterium QH_8_67_23]